MLRTQLNDALKAAMKGKDERAVGTLRLILAALKDRDIAARGKGRAEGIEEAEILQMLQTMIKQRREAIALYEQGGRLELAQQEGEEIAIIERFLPRPLEGPELEQAVSGVISELGATSLKDMGRTMQALKERYPGRMDPTRASQLVRARLG